ncbi:MAG TPA: Fe-Mn family superoxide dismutase [Pyrinomonadaceae bacterium]|nr:Fe-Mn family superoxide dismutase [Pyrinomonadaceae bacterium]
MARWRSRTRSTCCLQPKRHTTILSYNLHTGEVHNYWAWDHMHNAPMGYPLLVLDMYEHAYHMDYGAAAAKYVDAFMQNVNWDEVNRRVEAAGGRK